VERRRPTVLIAGVAWCVLAGLAGWQLWTVFAVGTEYYDGYDTIINARYLLGDAPQYIPVRFPAMAALAALGETLRGALGLDALDLRPVHLASAILHMLYLYGCWRLLRGVEGATGATLFAFLAAVPTYLYFTYAPFLSHDLAPGLGLLWMLILADRQLRSPLPARWCGLTLLGAACALVKPTFGLFWAVLLSAFAIALATESEGLTRLRVRRFGGVCAAAVGSAVLFWLVMSWTLSGTVYGDWPWWLRPWEQVTRLAGKIDDASASLWWVYLRNLPAFGALTALGILPGLWLALRGGRLQRAAAISWILSVAAVLALPRHEVRYLAFLAPLTALLLVAPVRSALARGRVATGVAVLALGVTWLPIWPYSPVRAALDPSRPFYGGEGAGWLLEPLQSAPKGTPLFFYVDEVVTLLPPGESPLVGDPFHQIFELGPHHPRLLLGWDGVTGLGTPESLSEAPAFPPGSFVFWGDSPRLTASVSWRGEGIVARAGHQQGLARSVTAEVRSVATGRYVTEAGVAARLVAPERLGESWRLETTWFDRPGEPLENPRLAVLAGPGQKVSSYVLVPEGRGRFQVPGLSAVPSGRLWFNALRIERRIVGGQPQVGLREGPSRGRPSVSSETPGFWEFAGARK